MISATSSSTPERNEGGYPLIRFNNPPTLGKPPGYSHSAEVSGPHRTLYIAGQLGLDLDRQVVGAPGDFEAQCRQAFENLKAVLESSGARLEHLVKINMYFTDIAIQLPVAAKIRDTYVNTAAPPASTSVEIRRLGRETLLFEIDAIAVIR